MDCEARDVVFFEPSVTPHATRLELRGIEAKHVAGIRAPHGNSMETTYDPSIVATTLRECGAPIRADVGDSGPQVSVEHIEIVERLMRAFRRANPVCKEDPNLEAIFTNFEWKTIEDLLTDHGVVTKERRAAGGRPKEFLRRRFRPDQIMAGLNEDTFADPRIRAFWRELALESEPLAASQRSRG